MREGRQEGKWDGRWDADGEGEWEGVGIGSNERILESCWLGLPSLRMM